MAQGLYLSQKLSLQQVLAPQLQQSLALLQAPILDLKALVEQELQQNPILEEVPVSELQREQAAKEGDTTTYDMADPAEPPPDVTYDPAVDKGERVVDDFQAEFERLSQLDQEWRDHFAQTNLPVRRSEEEEEKRQFMFDSLVAGTSLQDNLLEQMRLSDMTPEQQAIGELIIGNIDDYGYLTTSVDDLAVWMSNYEVAFTKTDASTPLPLGFVTFWSESYHEDPMTGTRTVRKSPTRLLEVRGRFLANPEAPELDRQAFLLARRDQWVATFQSAEGTFIREHYFNRAVKVLQFHAQITPAYDAIDWRLVLSYSLPFEEGPFTAVEFGLDTSHPVLNAETRLKVHGRVAAADAQTARAQWEKLQRSWLETYHLTLNHRTQESLQESKVQADDGTWLEELVFEEEFVAPSQETGIKWVHPDKVLEVLKIIQTFHPPGVGARDLRECLMLQLEREGRQNSLEYQIVRDYMELLGKRRLPEIAKGLGVPVDEVQRATERIALLDPRPGRSYLPDNDQYILPEVFVTKVGDDFVVTTNDEQIPHLRISNTYKDLMAQSDAPEEVKNYIREKIRAGKFLIKSLHQRQQTILNIAKEIVKRQREFMEKGVAYLKPLTMVQVAEVVGVHETTVSRAVSGKYMQTPQGVFEMKYFFTSGIQTENGEGMSNTSVKDMIADLFKKEDPHKPLSDQEVVKILAQKGIKIARRTVAKYRAELGILPSNLRKVY